jgi:tRNA pseudouridine32 synthase / 23S rRNA pseudouridine746 synthase
MSDPAMSRASSPSRLQLPAGAWTTVLDCLCERFPAIPRRTWIDRFARGLVLDAQGQALSVDTAFRVGAEILYFREVAEEPAIPFEERLLHVDENLVVADKPHWLPVAPTGAFVRQTLLTRLMRRLGNQALVPLHRLDRETAGLVLFSANPATRDAFQRLFRERRIRKHYQAIAPALPAQVFPLRRRSRLARGEPFFRMQEVEGEANSETLVTTIEQTGALWRYALEPVSGRKHQLRVHMAALGAPILNDSLYPTLCRGSEPDYAAPLKLLAANLEFVDPLSGAQRRFDSTWRL